MRLLLVVGLLVAVAMVTLAYRRRMDAVPNTVPRRLPPGLRRRSVTTWVVFTTPMCATCGPVLDHLRRSEHDAEVVAVDATTRPDLVAAFEVKTAPTVLRATSDGVIDLRLSGPAATAQFFALSRGSA